MDIHFLHNPHPSDGDGSFAFPVQCIMLKIVGAWPLANRLPSNRHFSSASTWYGRLYLLWSTAFILLIAVTCLAQSAFVFQAWGDILTVTECGCTVLMGIHNLLRLIHLSWNRKRLQQLNTEFVRTIWISKKKNKLVAKQCERDTFILKLVSGMLFVLIWMYVLVPLVELFTNEADAAKPFPYKMVFPYDANNGLLYASTYFFTSLAGFGVVTTLFAEDSLFGFFVAYICGQFRLLHSDIGAIMERAQKNAAHHSGSDVSEKDVQRECNLLLKKSIHHHNKIIRFCELMEEFFSPILLINYTISSFLICMVTFQIAAVNMTIGNLAKLLIYMVSAMSQLFILCWKGDRMIESSTETAWKLYACHWEGLPAAKNVKNKYGSSFYCRAAYCPAGTQFTKDLMFAIQRAQKPLCITALKFSVLSLKSFTAILSTSMSYFTLLQTLVEKND